MMDCPSHEQMDCSSPEAAEADKEPSSSLKTPLKVNELKYYYDGEAEATSEECRKLREAIESEMKNGGESFHAKPFPCVSLLQKLSKAAYNMNFQIEKPWLLLKNIYCANNAMKARIYINTLDRQLIVAFKGSSSCGDWITNIFRVGMKLPANNQCNSAATVGALAREILEQFHGRVHLIITGHSLGGYLAQLAAFSAQNLRNLDGNLKSVDFENCIEIYPHTVVFDSPAAAERILQSTFSNPVSPESLRLDVTNYIMSANFVNFYSTSTRHLGEVLFVKGDESDVLEYRSLRKMKHGINNFKAMQLASKGRVTDLCNFVTEPLDESKIPSTTFSKREYEALQTLPLLKPIHKNVAKQINYNIRKDYVKVFAEKADRFVPRMRLFLLENRELIKDHANQIEGFYLLIAHNFLKLLYEDFQDFEISLKPEYTQALLDSKHNIQIKCDKSLREKILLAQIICNSMPNTYLLKYKHYKQFPSETRNYFLSNFEGRLILILEDDDKFEKKEEDATKKCNFILLSKKTETSDNTLKALENQRTDIVSKESMSLIKEINVKFFQSLIPIKEICEVLPSDLDLIEVLDFVLSHNQNDNALHESEFYVEQRMLIVTRKTNYNIISFASSYNLVSAMKDGKNFIILSSDAGMGKTTFFSYLQSELTKSLPNHWIVKINLLEQCKYLNDLLQQKVKLNIDHAINFIKQSQQSGRTVFQMQVLEYLIKTKRVVILIDGFDEICPKYRMITLQIITLFHDSSIRFAVSTRPLEHEQIKNKLQCNEHFELKGIENLEEFFKNYFILRGKLSDEEAQSKTESLMQKFEVINKNTFEDLISFWKIPLHALMVAELHDKSESIVNIMDINLAGLFEKFVEKRICRDLEEKMNLSPIHPRQSSEFRDKKEKILYCLMQLALRENFTEYQEPDVDQLAEITERYESDINSTGIASIMEISRVKFTHYKFSEYLSIRFCLLNLQDNRVLEVMKQVLIQSTHWMKRKFLNDMVGNTIWPTALIEIVKENSKRVLVQICRDNLVKFFLHLCKSGISFDYNEVQRVARSQESTLWDEYDLPRPSKRVRTDDDDSDFFDDDEDATDFCNFSAYPLTLAITHASEKLVLELIGDGANLNTVLNDPLSNYEDILSHAIYRNMFKVINLIFEIRPLKNETNYETMCIIHWAIRAGDPALMQFLAKAGANIAAVDANGMGSLQIANSMCEPNQEITRFLEENLSTPVEIMQSFDDLNV